MKEKDSLTKILGISQGELAIILGVTRTQWSMYELGQRKLPPHAVFELNSILHYIQKNGAKKMPVQDFMIEEEQGFYDLLHKKMLENELIGEKLDRNIEKAQLLYEEGLAALRLVEYLEAQPENKRTATIQNVIQCRARARLKRNQKLLKKYQHDKELLQLQNTFIKKEMKKFKK
ncbi:helix-turn-helix domain-containing protein [Flavobacterium sp. GCM10027622]|uniref:helix-turn-helix domain-containing protein n=1 Tax=unclassified Flavobacterium TaxID=196869 RepID=UPI00362019B7